jgi:hypothetical protein
MLSGQPAAKFQAHPGGLIEPLTAASFVEPVPPGAVPAETGFPEVKCSK